MKSIEFFYIIEYVNKIRSKTACPTTKIGEGLFLIYDHTGSLKNSETGHPSPNTYKHRKVQNRNNFTALNLLICIKNL